MTMRKKTKGQNAVARSARIGFAEAQKAIKDLRALIAELREVERLYQVASSRYGVAQGLALVGKEEYAKVFEAARDARAAAAKAAFEVGVPSWIDASR